MLSWRKGGHADSAGGPQVPSLGLKLWPRPVLHREAMPNPARNSIPGICLPPPVILSPHFADIV
jgi:hypothetical protein